MPESSDAKTEIPLEQITDPAIAEFASGIEQELALAGQFIDRIRDIVIATGNYRQRNPTVEGLSLDVLARPGISGQLAVLGSAALEISREDALTPRIRLNRDKVLESFGSIPMSRLSLILNRYIELEGQEAGPIKNELDTAYALATEHDSVESWIRTEDVKTSLEPLKALDKSVLRFRGEQVTFEEEPLAALTEFAQTVKTLPSEATLNCIAGLVFLDTVRGLKGEEIRGVYSLENRRRLVELVKNPHYAILYEAARILDLAALAINETGQRDIVRHGMLGAIVGLSKFKIAASSRLTNMASSRFLSPHARLIVNAHEAMAEMHKAGVQRESLSVLFGGKEPQIQPITRSTYFDLSSVMAELNRVFYEAVPEIATTEELTQQMLILEQYKNARLQELVAKTSELGLLRRDEIRSMANLYEPKLRKQIEEQELERQLAELREFIDSRVEELAVLDQPYHYTANRIRSYAGGTAMLRDLDRDLDSKELLPDINILQTLAVLILQSDNTADKTAYYQQIIDCRFKIEQLMADLEYVGAGDHYKSPLASTLRWIDEILDSGQDEKITNNRLQDFIYEYYLGPDDMPEVIEDVIKPVKDSGKNQDATEPEPHGSAQAEQYLATLANILEDEAIAYVDINVFPPGKVERQRLESVRRDDLTFIDVDPKRLENLVRLKKSLEAQGKTANLMFTNHTGWVALPYFVLYVQEKSTDSPGVCVLENPINGNASYVFSVDGDYVRSWQEMARLTRQEARALGAIAFVHPAKGSSNFSQHYDLKIASQISLSLAQLRS